MPELPEVEAVRRLLDRVLVGRTIVEVEAAPDDIVFEGLSPEMVCAALLGKTVVGTGRKGKIFWLQLSEKPWLFGHLGMSGWVREVGGDGPRLVSHGDAPLDDEEGRPRFLKWMLTTDEGRRVAFTDGRRLGRVWLGDDPARDPRVAALGPDVLLTPISGQDLAAVVSKRKAPIKSLLLDQRFFAGVGNWVADEVLYQARIAPARLGASLSPEEAAALADALKRVVEFAVEVGADADRYPEDWLFAHRWGGKYGSEAVMGKAIRRDKIGGRTTAWVPDLQR